MGSFSFQIVSIFYMVLMSFVYFGKKKFDTLENRIYSILIVIMYITLFTDISSVYLALLDVTNPLTNVLCKLYLVSIIAWVYTFTYYIFVISSSKNDGKIIGDDNDKYCYFEKILIIFVCLFLISSCLVLLLPLNIFSDGSIMYTYGISAIVSYSFAGVCVLSWGMFIFSNINGIKNKKYIPVFLFVFLAILAICIQSYHKEILLVSSVAAFITILTYFTIENPDIKMIEQLEIAKVQADRANNAKTEFLSSMSHEIRTPLNAIVGFSDCISSANSLEEAKENAKDIVSASNTLLEIVNGILDISKIEAGKLEIVNAPYKSKKIFEELAKLITPRMDEKGLDFSYYIASDLPEVLYGDYASLKKVITNLLSNACKYTDTGFVKYEVNCVKLKDVVKLIITVEDSGRGIKKESVDKLFTKFQRFDEDKNATIEGTGLGLAITKQLVELMGGKIIVHTVYGEGSKFTIVLEQKISHEEIVDKKQEINESLDLFDVKILLVDDNELNLKVAKKLLEKYKANKIVSVNSGGVCLEKVKSDKFDVILLDGMMPKMNGVETLKKLKEIDGFNTPVVILTANAITGMREKYIQDGFDDYLAKPIEKEELIRVMNKVLDKDSRAKSSLVSDKHCEVTISTNNNLEVADNNKDSSLVENNSIDSDNTISNEKFLRDNGVDLDYAISLLGDMEMYNSTIVDFLKEVKEKWNNIVFYKEKNDMDNYAIEVHSLKSDAKYLGFMKLADIAYQHELKSKEKNSEFVNSHFSELEDEYNKIIKISEEYVKLNKL